MHLVRGGGEHHRPEYHALNPQELVPLLVDGDFALGQSLAIFQYLESRLPQPAPDAGRPARRPRGMWVFPASSSPATGIQPMQNTRVLGYLKDTLGSETRSGATPGCTTGWARPSMRWRKP